MTLAVLPLPDRIYEILREQIVTGELGSRSAVRQDVLAQSLGVSKIPVREALARLAQDGLLTQVPNRGWFVTSLSMSQAMEIYALRLSLEPAAAAYACLHATPPEQEAVARSYARLDEPGLDLAAKARRNRDFHLALVTTRDRPLTPPLIERLALLSERYVVQHLRPQGRGDRARREHAALHEAWQASDASSVQTLLSSHIAGTLDDLRLQLGSH